MKRGLVFIVLAGIAFALYWYLFKRKGNHPSGPPPEPIGLKKHSSAFNANVDSMVNAYLQLSNEFINQDTTAIKQATREFLSRTDSLNMEELKNDTLVIRQAVESNLEDLRSNAQSLLLQTDITEMRQDFRMITEMLYPAFFKTVNYEGPKLYLFYCDNAFGPEKGANWISNSTELRNPYWSNTKSANTTPCGEIKDTIKAH